MYEETRDAGLDRGIGGAFSSVSLESCGTKLEARSVVGTGGRGVLARAKTGRSQSAMLMVSFCEDLRSTMQVRRFAWIAANGS